MKLSSIEKKLREQIEPRIKDVTPGLMIRAYQDGKQVVDLAIGETYAYYDLASLTKIIFSVQAMMLSFDEKKWNLDTKVGDVLAWFPYKEIRIQDFLTHHSGLPWWLPIYKEMDIQKPLDERRQILKEKLISLEIVESDISVYSDIGLFVVGFLLEEFFARPIADVWNHIKERFYQGTTLDFHLYNQPKYRTNLYAPTEECLWRGRVMQGEVHDENAWSFGGISSHAGLFGSIDDVGWFALLIRSQLMGIARYLIRQKTAQLFCSRALPTGRGDWALGYMLPTPGAASCGVYFSLNSIGHTGFTGTSVWYDPKMDLAVVILSNRIAYGRDNKAFQFLRPEIHNWIVEGLRKASY